MMLEAEMAKEVTAFVCQVLVGGMAGVATGLALVMAVIWWCSHR